MRLPAIAWGGLAGLAAALLLAPVAATALGRLHDARADHDRVSRVVASPDAGPAFVAGSGTLRADSRDAANAALAARVRSLATRGGVLVEEAGGVADAAGLARVRLRVSGSEDAVVGLADAIEREAPVARFARWRISAAGGSVRLEGEVVAPWA